MIDKILKFIAKIFKYVEQTELIWENAAPGSSFGAQTVPIDKSKYDRIEIEGRVSVRMSANAGNTAYMTFAYNGAGDGLRGYSRSIEITDEGVKFSAATYRAVSSGAVTSNTSVVPLRIYGIKSIGGGYCRKLKGVFANLFSGLGRRCWCE